MSAPATLCELFFDTIERFATKRAALRFKQNGTWVSITHQQLARKVHHISMGLRELGLEPGDRVAIISNNRPEWAITDFACLNAGCADVAVYPSLPANQIEYLLNDSGSRAVFVEDQKQMDKVAEIRGAVPTLEHVIRFDNVETTEAMTFGQLEALGGSSEPKHPDYKERALNVTADDLATLIYTSGTTGDPKGVMLTHGNLTSNAVAASRALPIGSSDSCLSLLPLSHSFERTAGFYTMVHAGATINYAESIEALMSNIAEVRPTIVLSVPRLYEKIYAGVQGKALQGGAVKTAIFNWAERIGNEWADATLSGRTIGAGLAFKARIADKLVFSKLRAKTGGRLRYFASGGAPLSADIARFFFAAKLRILEGYGLTETSPIICVNPYEKPKLGTVGPPIEGVEVSIAEDGEILSRSPCVMRGYYNKPEATAEAIDKDGWFRTGDLGSLDEDGYLSITGRKKDIIVTAGGKNIAPQPIEERIKSSPRVLNAVMLGDRRRFPIILVVPEPTACEQWAVSCQMPRTPGTDLFDEPAFEGLMSKEVASRLDGFASYEIPKKVVLIRNDFTEESGELTPTMKVKRRIVEENYREQIEAAYREPKGA